MCFRNVKLNPCFRYSLAVNQLSAQRAATQMSTHGPSRPLLALQSLVAIGAWRTWPDLLQRPSPVRLTHLGHCLSFLDFHDHATVDLVIAHASEDAVDVFQSLSRVVDLHLAFSSELQALGEIESCPHD
jgi:hypothetical protein